MDRRLLTTLVTLSAIASTTVAIASPATSPANPDTTFDKERFTREVTKSPDLPNFHEVHPYLYRSGEPTEAGLQRLKDHNIKTVIDLRAPTEKALDEKKWAEANGVKYINLPMSSQPPTKQQVDTFMAEVQKAKADTNKNGAVLVHCAHGSDRTGCMVGIWRVTQDGYDYDKAYKEMRHYWFTPKFTKLSGTVAEYAAKNAPQK
jgi:protein tyrosine/serine phosphatase